MACIKRKSPMSLEGQGERRVILWNIPRAFSITKVLLSKERTKALFQLWEMYPQLQHSPAFLFHLRGFKVGSYVTGGKLRKEGSSPETQNHYKAENLIISLQIIPLPHNLTSHLQDSNMITAERHSLCVRRNKAQS